jgi:hypothetical protein
MIKHQNYYPTQRTGAIKATCPLYPGRFRNFEVFLEPFGVVSYLMLVTTLVRVQKQCRPFQHKLFDSDETLARRRRDVADFVCLLNQRR